MVEYFKNGAHKGCSRSCKFTYSFGSGTKILSAREPRQCYYEFEVQIDKSLCPTLALELEQAKALELEKAAAEFEAIGITPNALTIFAVIGALTMMYYGLKSLHKMVFATNDFQEIDQEC